MTNQIEAAVLPLKSAAIERAAQDTRVMIGNYLTKIIENGNDLKVAFPRGNSLRDSRNDYLAKQRRHSFASAVTTRDLSKPYSYRMDEPYFVVASAEKIERMVTEAQEMAAQQYDLFVAKLVRKVGEVVSATLSGNHVWGHSILTITKADGSVERWKTQQIVNQSVLGTLFNQWPTRKVK
jgi:hypothetical protein